MFRRCDSAQLFRAAGRRRRGVVVVAMWFLSSGIAAAQDPGHASAGTRRITLSQAQQLAAAADNPLVRLGELQVEAAKQHRLGVQSLYFPNFGMQAENLHFNQFLGEVLTVQRPIAGTILSIPATIINQDQTALNVSVAQPITPLFAIHQLVKIARADENIARAKAGMSVEERESLVEKNYFDLLVADRELAGADAQARTVQAKWVTVSNPGTRVSPEQQLNTLDAARSLSLASSKVKEVTADLNELLGLPADTRLELVPPEPLVENLSIQTAAAQASSTGAEVIEAEQTAVKAHAASKLSKMEYFPTIAIMGGYAHQTALNVILPETFAYVGVVGTYTLFDSFKREHGVKEATAQAAAADLGVQLTKAKAAAAVKTAYFELERSRELTQLARQMVSAPRVVEASYVSDGHGVDPAQAKMEAELFRAELEYRQAYARVKSLMGDK